MNKKKKTSMNRYLPIKWKIPLNVIIDNILIYYEYNGIGIFNIYKFYGYFKCENRNPNRKLFFLWKSCRFAFIKSKFFIPVKITSLNMYVCLLFVGDKIPNIRKLTVWDCPFFVGDNLPNVTGLDVGNCPLFVGDKIPNVRKLKVIRSFLFIGDNLPNVINLKVMRCPLFIGDKIPNMTDLDVGNCPLFVGDKIPSNVTDLNVWGCPLLVRDKRQNKEGSNMIKCPKINYVCNNIFYNF